MKKLLLTIVPFLCFLGLGVAQDLSYINLNSSKSLLNPTSIGINTYRYSPGLNYRQSTSLIDSQNANRLYSIFWQGSYMTNSFDQFSFELRVSQDNPSNTIIRKTDFSFSGVYKKQLVSGLQADHSLSFGIITGVNMLNPVNRAYWFGSQYDVDDQNVNLGLPSGEIDFNQLVSRTAFDLGIGIGWHSHFNSIGDINAGIAVYHLLPYNQALYEGNELLISRRFTAFVNAQILMGNNTMFSSTPSLTIQDPFFAVKWRNMILVNTRSQQETSFGFGLSPRVVKDYDGVGLESVSLLTMINLPGWQLEFSYDFGTNDIAQFSDGRGSIELGVSYFFDRVKDEFKPQQFY